MKKKIYITSLHLKHGGVEMAVSLLANALCRRDYEVEILCTYRLCDPVYPLDPGVKVTYLTEVKPNREAFQKAMNEKNLLGALREGVTALKVLRLKKKTMKQALAAIREGTVICTRNEHAVLLSKVGKQGVRKIAQLHNDHGFEPALIKDFQRGYRNIDYFALLTEQTKEEVEGFLRGHNDTTQCVVIPNFLEKPYEKPICRKKKQAVAVGRLHPDKGFDRMLRIWSDVVKQHPDWCLKIIGEGALQPDLERMAEELKIAGNVVFTGALAHDQVMDEMAESSIYLMTSPAESFGFVLVEAMSCATPPIAFDVRVGPRSIITDKKDGFLILDGDEKHYAACLESLMSNPEQCARMGQNAQKRSADFLEDSVMKRWEQIL